jgi:hypothetical protein
MAGLMMMEPDPGKQYCRVKSAKHGDTRIKCRWISHGWFFERGQSQVKEVLQVELKLPSWEVLMQLLVARGLLTDEESGLPLLGWLSLLDQQAIVPLEDLMAPIGLTNSSLENLSLLQKVMKMRPPLGWVIQPWMDLLVEPLGHLPAVLPWLLLQRSN